MESESERYALEVADMIETIYQNRNDYFQAAMEEPIYYCGCWDFVRFQFAI